MNPANFGYYAAIVAIYTVVVGAALLALCEYGKAGCEAAIAWARRTFTSAGDHACIDCARTQMVVYCSSCNRTRLLTPTSTLPTPDGLPNVQEIAAHRRAQARQRDLEAMRPPSRRAH